MGIHPQHAIWNCVGNISGRREARLTQHCAALVGPIEQQKLLFHSDRLALVKDAGPGAHDQPAICGRCGEGDAWRQTLVVVEVRLKFVAQPNQQTEMG